jgi:hypothetical protein
MCVFYLFVFVERKLVGVGEKEWELIRSNLGLGIKI